MFTRLINYIKDAAWLQPFLFALFMFGMISLIPITSNFVRNHYLFPNDHDVFFKRFKINFNEANSLFKEYELFKKGKNLSLKDDHVKYFILFLDKKNSSAKEFSKSVYEVSNSKGSDGKKIIFFVVYVDENKDDFKKIILDNEYFFEDVLKAAKKSSAFANRDISDKEINNINDPNSFIKPLLLLINFEKKESIDVFFDIKGSDDHEKISFLYDCWDK